MTGVIIVLIVMSFAALMAKWGMDHDIRMKQLKRGKDADNSLRVSELQELIQNAVEEATAPLQARIATLEHRLDRQLPPHAEGSEETPEIAPERLS